MFLIIRNVIYSGVVDDTDTNCIRIHAAIVVEIVLFVESKT